VVTSSPARVQFVFNSEPVNSSADLGPSPTTDSLCVEPDLIPATQDCVDNNDNKVEMNGASSTVAATSVVVACVTSKDSGLIGGDVDGRDGASTPVKSCSVTLAPLPLLLVSSSSSPSRDSTSSKTRGPSTPSKLAKSKTKSPTPRKSPKPSTPSKSTTPLKSLTSPKSSTLGKWLTAASTSPTLSPRQRSLIEMFSHSRTAPQTGESFSAVAAERDPRSDTASADPLRIAAVDLPILVEDSQADAGLTSPVRVVVDTQESMFVDDTPPKSSGASLTDAAAADDNDDNDDDAGFSELQRTVIHVDSAEQRSQLAGVDTQLTTTALNVDSMAAGHSGESPSDEILSTSEDLMSETDLMSPEARSSQPSQAAGTTTSHDLITQPDVVSNTVSTKTTTAVSCEIVDHTRSITLGHTQSDVIDHTKPGCEERTQQTADHTEDMAMYSQAVSQRSVDDTQDTTIDHTQAVEHTQDSVIDHTQAINLDPSQSAIDHTQETAMDHTRDDVIGHTHVITQHSVDNTQETIIDHTQASVDDSTQGDTMDTGETVAVVATSSTEDSIPLMEVMQSPDAAATSFLSSDDDVPLTRLRASEHDHADEVGGKHSASRPLHRGSDRADSANKFLSSDDDVPLTRLRASQQDHDVSSKHSVSGPSRRHSDRAEDASRFFSSDDDVPLTHLKASQESDADGGDGVGSSKPSGSGPGRPRGSRKDAMRTTLQGRVSRRPVETRPTRISLRTRSVRRVTSDLVNLGAKKADVRHKRQSRLKLDKSVESTELKEAMPSRPLPRRPRRTCKSAWMKVAPMLSKDAVESGSRKKNQREGDVGSVACDMASDANPRMTSTAERSDDLLPDSMKARSEEPAKNVQAEEMSGVEKPADDVADEEQVDLISVMPTPDVELLSPEVCGEPESGQEMINSVEKSADEVEVQEVDLNCVVKLTRSCEVLSPESFGKPESGQVMVNSAEKSADDVGNQVEPDLNSVVKPTRSGEVLSPEFGGEPESGQELVNADKVHERSTEISNQEECSSDPSTSEDCAPDMLTSNTSTTDTDIDTLVTELTADSAAVPISVPNSSDVICDGNNKEISDTPMTDREKSTPVNKASGEHRWKVPTSSSVTRGSQTVDAPPETPTSVPRRRLITSRGSMILERAKQLRESVAAAANPPGKKSSAVEPQGSEEDLVDRSPGGAVGRGSGLSKLRVFSPAASPSASILRKRQLSIDSATSSGQSPTSPSSGRVSCIIEKVLFKKKMPNPVDFIGFWFICVKPEVFQRPT